MGEVHSVDKNETTGLCEGDDVKRCNINAGEAIKEPEMKEKEMEAKKEKE